MVTYKKFTKGEWINLGYRVDVDIADGLSGICEMSDWMTEEEMEANAKLIAAAPELLQVSIKCLQWCNSAMSPEFVNKLRIEAETAIKKATE